MNALKYAATTAALAMPLLVAGAPAEAVTARQYISQGQGLYTTSKNVPEGFVADYSAQQQGASVRNQIRDFEHHGRYFGGE